MKKFCKLLRLDSYIFVKCLPYFFLFWLLLNCLIFIPDFISGNENLYLENIYLGIPIHTVQQNVDKLGFIFWLLGVTPPVLLSLLFIYRSAGSHAKYVLLRYRSYPFWLSEKLICVFLLPFEYIGIGLLVSCMFAGAFHSENSFVLEIFCKTMPVYPLFLSFVAMVLCLFHLLMHQAKYTIALYCVIFCISPYVGITNAELNKIMPGCYGMIARSNLYDPDLGFSLHGSILILFLLCLLIITKSHTIIRPMEVTYE